jgi:mannose-1-phosphate guanylyltransferase
MRAVLLAAGLGTRLRPLTDSTPKCLLEVAGRPLLDRWLDALADAGVEEVLVNLHHLPDRVEEHLADRPGSAVRVRTVYEPTLLGSAGTLVANRGFLGEEEAFLALNADNLTDFDLRELLAARPRGATLAAVAVFGSPRPSECGVVEVSDGVITSFEEKPARPRSNLANAGMYLFAREVLDLVVGPLPQDLGHHLLPRLVGRARAVDIGPAYFTDIGTPAALAQARLDWEGSVRS